MGRKKFFVCEKCGKKLIERDENGLWHFVFGKYRDEEGNILGVAPVDMYIYGSVKLKCLRRGCDCWNVLNFFPFNYVNPANL
jgi:hypothetical protein